MCILLLAEGYLSMWEKSSFHRSCINRGFNTQWAISANLVKKFKFQENIIFKMSKRQASNLHFFLFYNIYYFYAVFCFVWLSIF